MLTLDPRLPSAAGPSSLLSQPLRQTMGVGRGLSESSSDRPGSLETPKPLPLAIVSSRADRCVLLPPAAWEALRLAAEPGSLNDSGAGGPRGVRLFSLEVAADKQRR